MKKKMNDWAVRLRAKRQSSSLTNFSETFSFNLHTGYCRRKEDLSEEKRGRRSYEPLPHREAIDVGMPLARIVVLETEVCKPHFRELAQWKFHPLHMRLLLKGKSQRPGHRLIRSTYEPWLIPNDEQAPVVLGVKLPIPFPFPPPVVPAPPPQENSAAQISARNSSSIIRFTRHSRLAGGRNGLILVFGVRLPLREPRESLPRKEVFSRASPPIPPRTKERSPPF
jgi:hypothetical protein